MAADVIDGKTAARDWHGEVAKRTADIRDRTGWMPGLRVVIVGDNPASRAYVNTKSRVAEKVGIHGQVIELPDTITTDDLLAQIQALNTDPKTHGILVQLPLPAHVDEARVLTAIDPDKDVDGFHPVNVGRLVTAGPGDLGRLLIPCTPLGCLRLLDQRFGRDKLAGKEALVIGRSNIVGKPMSSLLLAANCTVTVAHSKTADLGAVCRRAEIIIAAVGRPRFVPATWVTPGAVVIDVGINRVDDADGGAGRLVGDVDFAKVREVAAAITPVPGGVGPMTVAGLMHNTLIAAAKQGLA